MKQTNLQLAFRVMQEIKDVTEDTIERDEIIEIMRKCKESDDVHLHDWRFISEDSIDDILKDELSSDVYMLGCFTAHFIADMVDLPVDEVEKAQKNESYELLGALMLKNIDEVVEGYVAYDGYGHHFNPYDGDEQGTTIDGTTWYMFRTN